MDYASPRAYDLDFYTTSGSLATRTDGTAGGDGGNKATMGRTLLANTTYYVPLGSVDAPTPAQTQLICCHLKWDAAAVLTISIETTCFASLIQQGKVGPADVTDWDTAKGNWIKEDPSTAYISTTSTDASTGGGSVSNATVTVAGGTAGGCTIHVGNIGSRRVRIKVVAGGTGGAVRAACNGKLGA